MITSSLSDEHTEFVLQIVKLSTATTLCSRRLYHTQNIPTSDTYICGYDQVLSLEMCDNYLMTNKQIPELACS